MLTLTVVDNKDGTATFTATGVTSAAVLRVSGFAGEMPAMAFSDSHTFAADGSQTLTLSVGPYFGYLTEGSEVSDMAAFRVSDTSIGIHDRCLYAIKDYMLSLSLPGIPTEVERHKVLKKPIRATSELGRNPTGIYYWKNPEQQRLVYNTYSDFVFPVQVLVIQPNGGDNTLSTSWSLAREIASRSFAGCPLQGDVGEVHSVDVRHMAIYADSDSSSLDVGSLVFDCKSQIPNLI